MQTWTYTAIRHDQCESPAPHTDGSSDGENENILETDDQEITNNCKQVQKTRHDDKLKLNDYIFDER